MFSVQKCYEGIGHLHIRVVEMQLACVPDDFEQQKKMVKKCPRSKLRKIYLFAYVSENSKHFEILKKMVAFLWEVDRWVCLHIVKWGRN